MRMSSLELAFLLCTIGGTQDPVAGTVDIQTWLISSFVNPDVVPF